MTIEMNIRISSKDSQYDNDPNDPKKRERQADQFIQTVRHFNLLVLKDERKHSLCYFAFGNGIIVKASCPRDQQAISDRIDKELKPLSAIVGQKEETLAPGDIRFDYVDSSTISELPYKIRWELDRSQTRNCRKCGRKIAPGDYVRWCPYCGHDTSGQDQQEGEPLKVCLDCPKDPEGGSLYHQSYRHCPRCGQKLQSMRKLHSWDYDLEEGEFLGDGQPLNRFTITLEQMPAAQLILVGGTKAKGKSKRPSKSKL